jgi:NADH:ubiquinone oxidoreductase 49 kD subunit 7
MGKEKIMRLNFGPVHPAMHGVLKVILDVKGDTVIKAQTEIGFLHRASEKIAEMRYFSNYYPIMDKLDYVSALNMEILYASVVEKAANIEIPPRAVYIRTIMAEIQRIMSHLIFIGSFGEDIGNMTGFIWALRERELLMNIVEKVSGGRLAPMYICNGGMFYDFPQGIEEEILKVLSVIENKVNHEYNAMFTKNQIFLSRTKGIGIITTDMIKKYGITGPIARASGINRDLRKVSPYLAYDKVDFDIPTEKEGDTYSRFVVRIREVLESIKIIRQCIKDLPAGPYKTVVPWIIRIPKKDTLVKQESPRGEMGVFLVTDGSDKPYRLKLRSPTFFAIHALQELLVNIKIADIFVIVASIDPVMGEVDR